MKTGVVSVKLREHEHQKTAIAKIYCQRKAERLASFYQMGSVIMSAAFILGYLSTFGMLALVLSAFFGARVVCH